jgi:hypothetical protein
MNSATDPQTQARQTASKPISSTIWTITVHQAAADLLTILHELQPRPD